MAFGVNHFFRRRRTAWLTLVAGLTLTAALGWQMHREAVEMDRKRLAMRVSEITSQLDARLEKSEMLLHNLRDYLMLSGESRNQVFTRWCYENGLSINCPWLYGIAVLTNRNLAQWHDQLPNPPATWAAADWEMFGELAQTQLVDCSIELTSDVKGNVRFRKNTRVLLLFKDLHPIANTIKGSRATMGPRGKVMLDGNSNLIAGTSYFVGVYRPEVANFLAVEGLTKDQREAARWMNLTSLILSTVDFDELVRSVWDGVPADLGMEVFSSTNQSTATWLSNSKNLSRAVDPKFKAYLTHRQPWPMYGQLFSIFFYTTPLFEAQSPRRLAWITIAAGTTLTLLATALVGIALRARNRQELLTSQIRDARDALAAAQHERNKISRDLHDGTIQSLYAIQLGLGHTVEKLKVDPGKSGRELSAVRKELDLVIAEIRKFITAEAGAGKPVDFSAVLRALLQRARAGTNAQIEAHCDPGASDRLAGDQAVHLANIAREALSNSLRHAKPQRVQIALRSEREEVRLEVSDDGAGFDPKATGRAGVGLSSMEARAHEMGGTLEIQSSSGRGTLIIIRIPSAASDPGGSESLATASDES